MWCQLCIQFYPSPAAMARYMCLMGSFDDDYEMVTKTRRGNLGTDLSTLDAVLDSGQF